MGALTKAKFYLKQFPFIVPPRIVYSCKEWIAAEEKRKGTYQSQRGAWYKVIFPEGFLRNPSPKTPGQPNEKAFRNNRSYITPQATLFCLQNCYLFGHKGMVLSARHEVYQEFSHHFNIASLKKFFWKNPFYIFSNSVKNITGVGALLVSPESHNYYHWLNDVLPRIRLYEEVMDQIDHFCVASNVPAKFLNILKDFGVPSDKILLVDDKEKLHFDHLFVSSLPGSEGRSPLWAVNYIREKLIKTHPVLQASKKVYFKRGDSSDRKIVNEDAIVDALKNKGFEIVDPGAMAIYDQINLVQQAAVIVGAHGAALSNLLFANEGTRVVELFSPDYFRTDCYYTLAGMLKLDYYYLAGVKPPAAGWGDIIVDEKNLLSVLT